MPGAVVDFRTQPLDVSRLDASGKDVGRKSYWRLFTIENLARILLHSVLSVQIGLDWLDNAVDPDIRGRVGRSQNDYARQPWHTNPGGPEVYFTQLPDLTRILRTNSH